ncbi:MAG: hypothetical protein A3F90_10665 [Deltaproteobacteria bacterium RIFCSPLOWO2_12_FULL_60_19]|nr:MAG: hypothetical protein A3F90_10665 [Deltaproteobacteria bacterium RIFCSPLOWO2_12_FULL_60_19]
MNHTDYHRKNNLKKYTQTKKQYFQVAIQSQEKTNLSRTEEKHAGPEKPKPFGQIAYSLF